MALLGCNTRGHRLGGTAHAISSHRLFPVSRGALISICTYKVPVFPAHQESAISLFVCRLQCFAVAYDVGEGMAASPMGAANVAVSAHGIRSTEVVPRAEELHAVRMAGSLAATNIS